VISRGELDPGGIGAMEGGQQPHWAVQLRVQVAELRWSLPHGAARPRPVRPTRSPGIG
jgi:hypothetical protein